MQMCLALQQRVREVFMGGVPRYIKPSHFFIKLVIPWSIGVALVKAASQQGPVVLIMFSVWNSTLS